MDPGELIQRAIDHGDAALSEYHAKLLLSRYGIPVTRETLAQDVQQAIEAAKEIGYPVALKACSSSLMHKSEGGLVQLNLATNEQVRQAFDRIAKKAPGPLEGVLVQEMISGYRELLVGMTRDAQFGPCVVLGLGGVMTEVFQDTAFRMAPVDAAEAEDMIRELKSGALLGPFRGQQPADRKAIIHCLTAIGRIAMEHPGVSEIDVNPLIVTPEGRVTAVDALVVLAKR